MDIKALKKYFCLYSNCIPVQGATRSVVCDLQYGKYYFIPNSLYDILKEAKGKRISEIVRGCSEKEISIVFSYFQYLESLELGFWSESIDKGLSDLDLNSDSPSLVTNIIIDIDSISSHPFETIASQIDELGCQALQLRFFDAVQIGQLDEILSKFINSTLRDIQVILKWSHELNDDAIEKICKKHLRVSSVLLHSAFEEKNYYLFNNSVSVALTDYPVVSSACCGEINQSNFVTNIPAFTESIHFNSCLNRKISIDKDGLIKNCPSNAINYGNITQQKLRNVALDKRFQSLWNIKKDEVDICKVCEFRYICTDCRVYLENPDDIYSKPLKCGYDPYSCKWEAWTSNPLKLKVFECYESHEVFHEFTIKPDYVPIT